MKRMLAIWVVLALISIPVMAEDLKKMSLDDVSLATPKIQNDSVVKTEGKSSIKITTKWPTTVYLGEVAGLNIENAKLIYKADVKSDLEGVAYLEMWAHVGSGQYFSKGLNDPIKGKSDWKSIRAPFIFKKGQKPDKITLNLVINGKGTVWIDNIVLSKEPLK
jgi:hypothetical protein